jgi:lipopolysaccharide core galacturonosyltransferase RgtB
LPPLIQACGFRAVNRSSIARRAGRPFQPCYATDAAPIPERLDHSAASALAPDPGACSDASWSRREDGSIDRDARASGGGPRTFALLLAAYAVVHAALRVWISPILNIDDAREAIFSQTLAWGYQPRQPPLYTWLVWATVRLAGVSVASLTVLKYAVLAVAYVFAYLTARRVLKEPRLPSLAAFSLLLLPPVGWFVHDDLTQSVAVLATAAATVYLLVVVEAAPTSGRYTWLGVAIALGTLSKLTYLVFAAALGLAALTVAPYRRRLRDPRAVVTLLVAVALIVPYAFWLATYQDDLSRFVQQVGPGGTRSFAAGVVDGLGAVLRAFAYYAVPLALVFLALFPGVYRRRPPGAGLASPAGLLVERTLLAGLALLVVGAFLNVLGQLKFRWAIPLFFLLPLYGCWRLDQIGLDARRRRRLRMYAVALAATETLMIAGILLQTYAGARAGLPARLSIPFDAVGPAVAAAGFRRGTIITGPGPLGGNVRLAFPDSRVASLETPGYLPPPVAGAVDGECLLVWDRGPADALPEDLTAWLRARLDVEAPASLSIGSVTAPHRHAPTLEYRAFFVRLPRGSQRCR